MRLRTQIGASMMVLTAAACASDAPATDAPATALTSTESTTTPETTAPPVSTDMTVEDDLAVTTPSSTSAAAAAASVDLTSRCTEAPEAIVEAVLFDLRSNVAPTACLRPELDDQLETLRGSSFNFEVESTGSQFENVVEGTAGWSVGVALDFDNEQGATDRVIQSWELVQVGPNLIINEVEELETDRAVAEAEATVSSYLSDLAAGRFDEAAAPLGEGGLNWDERFDITAFPSLPQTSLELADALARWCSSGALCTEPTTTVSRPTIRGGAAEVTATWNIDNEETTATFFSGDLLRGDPSGNTPGNEYILCKTQCDSPLGYASKLSIISIFCSRSFIVSLALLILFWTSSIIDSAFFDLAKKPMLFSQSTMSDLNCCNLFMNLSRS